MHPQTIIANALRRCVREGPLRTIQGLARIVARRFYEWRYGISTEGVFYLDQFGLAETGRCEHWPVDYADFRKMLAAVELREGKDVFLDYGAGRGRAIILGATYPFKRVIGVELCKEFAEQAIRNIASCRAKLACKDIQCIVADATAYEVPSDVTVVLFNNPFYGDVLDRVLERIRQSLETNPRRLVAIGYLPMDSIFETQIRAVDWLTLEQEMTLSTGRKALIFRA